MKQSNAKNTSTAKIQPQAAPIVQGPNVSVPDAKLPDASENLDDVSEVGDLPSHIVGIGASAGGLEAMERFFRAMPVGSNLCFVVVQHLSPDFKSLMGELLRRFNEMEVVPVEESERVRPNTIFLLPPRKELTLQGNYLVPRAREKDGALSRPINTFFSTLATEWGERSVAIVLSGTGSDGTRGVMEVRNAGGVVLAQSPETAAFDGMPQSAIRTGCVDAILAPEDMPEALVTAAARIPFGARNLLVAHHANQTAMALILDILNRAFGNDFNDYKSGMIVRRIERRASLKHPPISLDDYAHLVADDPTEINELYKDLLIGVTAFFRDPDVFGYIADHAIPRIIEQYAGDEEIRVWTAGCSTGEESYSLAILFLEELSKRGLGHKKLKVIATDLHEDSLRLASDGVYMAESLSNASPEYVEKYFTKTGDGYYKVKPSLRRCIVFSRHNLINDPPFTRMHVASCRNLLIYLLPKAQQKVIANMAYSLVPNGTLLLGISENSSDHPGLEIDSPADRKYKIYRKSADFRPHHYTTSALSLSHLRAVRGLALPQPQPQPTFPRIYEALLAKLILAGIVLDENREIIHIFGNLDELLTAPQGRFSGDLVRMLPRELGAALNSAIHKVAKDRSRRIELRGISAGLKSGVRRLVNMTVDPVEDILSRQNFYLVNFHFSDEQIDIPTEVINAEKDLNQHNSSRLEDLERELFSTRETLQTTIEELATTNEELQSANEELLSSNEELQSTNEELHSVNEELYSVNSEHEAKIEDLNRVTNKLHYLMQSTDTTTIFLDKDEKITLFTPGALRIFPLQGKDVGRPLMNFKSRVVDEFLFDDLKKLQAVPFIERALAAENGIYWLRRTSLLRDESSTVIGYVLNYTDITTAVNAQISRDNFAAVFDAFMTNMAGVMWACDEKGCLTHINQAFCDLFGVSEINAIGKKLSECVNGQSAAEFDSRNIEILKHGGRRDFTKWLTAANGKSSLWHSHRFVFTGAGGEKLLGGIITPLHEFEAELDKKEVILSHIIEKYPFGVAVFDKSGNCEYTNGLYSEILGISPENIKQNKWTIVDHLGSIFHDKADNLIEKYKICLRDQIPVSEQFQLQSGAVIEHSCQPIDDEHMLSLFHHA